MKLPKISNQKLALVAVAVVSLLCLLLPATALAVNGQQVDVCGTSSGAANCNVFIEKYINPLVLVLTTLVGIAAVLSIIIAGIQYSASADDPGTVTKAKQRIFNTIIGLVTYIFLLALFNWLIPGGIF